MATTLLEAIPFVMDIVDEQGTVLRVSPKLEAITGKGVLGGSAGSFTGIIKGSAWIAP